MDRDGLADFLRRRREALQPEDVGLPRGPRRRTAGLRREEVAVLAGMSTDYYGRLEQRRGPQPSGQMIAALARGLRLSLDERDHLFVLAGHNPPRRTALAEHVSPGMMRILDRLADTPAQVINELGETLVQTRLAAALVGDQTHLTGPARGMVYRWFTAPETRDRYPEYDHERLGRIFTAQLRAAASRGGPGSRAMALAAELSARSAEFAGYWREHQVGLHHSEAKTFRHPDVGDVTVFCQVLVDPDQEQALLVFTATPGTDSADRLELLSVIADQVAPAG